MTRKRTFVIAAVAAAGLTVAVASVGVFRPHLPAYAAAIAAETGAFGSGHHGWRQGRGHGLDRLCAEGHEERVGEMIALVENFVDFSPEQAPAWADLTTALYASNGAVSGLCDELEAAGKPTTAPQALARVETAMGVGLKVVRDLRPAFDAFYAALDEGQRNSLDRLVAKGHRR